MIRSQVTSMQERVGCTHMCVFLLMRQRLEKEVDTDVDADANVIVTEM